MAGDPIEPPDLELELELVHPGIPRPQLGFSVDWAARNAGIARLQGDQRACPGITAREQTGLTIFMPYTVRFHRDGSLEITHFWGDDDDRVVRVVPQQARIGHRGGELGMVVAGEAPSSDDRRPVIPGAMLPLPTPHPRMRAYMFVLGDMRLRSWIVGSGVRARNVPRGYAALLLPLPNYVYPPGYSIGQAESPRFADRSTNLNIGIDLDFSKLDPGADAVTITRGAPMMQYLFVPLPRMTLRTEVTTSDSPEPGLTDRFELTPMGHEILDGADLAQLAASLRTGEHLSVEMPTDVGEYSFQLTRVQLEVLRSAVAGEPLTAALAARGVDAAMALQQARELVAIGLLATV